MLKAPHIHWHTMVHDTGINSYGECRCGHRKVWKGYGAWQPIDRHWLNGGEWNRPIRPPAPTKKVPL